MSWSFYATGKPGPVLEKARKELSAYKCSEPEETIKGKVLNILEASLLAMPDDTAVTIKAGGSQSQTGADATNNARSTNTLSFEITPIFGFVE